jgi:hypothetical protein
VESERIFRDDERAAKRRERREDGTRGPRDEGGAPQVSRPGRTGSLMISVARDHRVEGQRAHGEDERT